MAATKPHIFHAEFRSARDAAYQLSSLVAQGSPDCKLQNMIDLLVVFIETIATVGSKQGMEETRLERSTRFAFPLLVLTKGIYHYWTYFLILSRGLKQTEVNFLHKTNSDHRSLFPAGTNSRSALGPSQVTNVCGMCCNRSPKWWSPFGLPSKPS